MFATSSEKRAAWAWAAGDYKLQFFTPEENDLLDRVMDLIIPADAHSGGAHAANVSLFADRVVSTGSDVANVDLFTDQTVSSDSQKSEWRKGDEGDAPSRALVKHRLGRSIGGVEHILHACNLSELECMQ